MSCLVWAIFRQGCGWHVTHMPCRPMKITHIHIGMLQSAGEALFLVIEYNQSVIEMEDSFLGLKKE